MTQQKVPHKHAALIKQWADGAAIQYKPHNNLHDWKDADESLGSIGWHTWCDYRIKPEPKPDVVVYQTLGLLPERQRVISYIETTHRFPTDNVMFIFDGETGALKDCQVLAKE